MSATKNIQRIVSVAPMMDWTDRHERFFLRLISKHTLLYTEMLTTAAILHGNKNRLLDFSAEEHPIAIQLGGSDPAALAACSRISEEWGYNEINLNVGCPSDRVQSGRFGACLMAEPRLVAECIRAMQDVTPLPVTVKCRIGIDAMDSYSEFAHFIETLALTGCEVFIIHARKAWLTGLSPKKNRDIPPLRYDYVYRLKQDYPELSIVLNGGISSLAAVREHLNYVDGVMLGRSVYHNPFILNEIDREFYQDTQDAISHLSRKQILEQYYPYVEKQLASGVPLNSISRHIMGFFHGCVGARSWRRYISENAHKQGAGVEVLQVAAGLVQE